MKKVIIVFVATILLASCKQSVLSDSFIYFNQPQPEKVEVIGSFPKKYLGTFAMDASHQITIKSKYVILNQIDTMEVAKNDLDSIPNVVFKNNQITEKETGKVSKAWVKNDTVRWEIKNQDTIFSFAKNEIAKEYKSSLILNKKVDNNFQVSYVKFSNSAKQLVQLGTKNDAVLIQNKLKIKRDIIFENGDTTHIVLSPTRADFRKLLRLEGMEFRSTYLSK